MFCDGRYCSDIIAHHAMLRHAMILDVLSNDEATVSVGGILEECLGDL